MKEEQIWNKLSRENWEELLKAQPQFADKCPYSDCRQNQQKDADKCNSDELEGRDWNNQLSAQPQFADQCDWRKLKGKDWAELLAAQPQFADKCDKWNKLYIDNWADLLAAQPQFADKCDKWSKFNGYNWARLLAKQPQFTDRCDKWSKFNVYNWARLLSAQPQFADRCDKWNKLDSYNWAELLAAQPQFADKCDKWNKLYIDNWADLLAAQPQFADKFDEWHLFNGYNWARLLSAQPQFAGKCKWRKLHGSNWASLLAKQPQLLAAATAEPEKTGEKHRLRLEFWAWGLEHRFKTFDSYDPDKDDRDAMIEETLDCPDLSMVSFAHADDDFEIHAFVDDKEVYHKKFKDRWHLKDVQSEYIDEALLNELNCDKDAFLKQAEEQKKTVFYANLREKGAYTLAPEGTEIEITGKFDPKELTLLEYEMMEEGVNGDDFLSGVIAVDYDGQICPLMIDGDVFGINDWAVITPDEGLAFSSMDDD